MTGRSRELEEAIAAARAGGAVVRRWYDSAYTVSEKGHDSPVTEADVEADRCIRARLAAAFPDDGWLSEETRDTADRLGRRRVWVVDPLDGTKEFIRRIPEFCVCVALVEAGQPRLGVIYNPVREELFAAERGCGTTLNGEPVRVSSAADLRGARLLASRSEFERGEWDAFTGECHVELTGSVAYKLALIAAGRADGTFSLTPKNEWDVCAGAALVLEAGGRITDRHGHPLVFNRPDPLLPGIIATNARLFDPVVDLLRRHGALAGSLPSGGGNG